MATSSVRNESNGFAMRALSLGACIVLGSSVAMAATPAERLQTSDGSRMEVMQLDRLVLPGGSLGASSTVLGGGLGYVIVDRLGAVEAGTIPGTGDLRGTVAMGLAQQPGTDEVYLAFTSPEPAGTSLLFCAWNGRAWTDPRTLAHADAPVTSVALTFRPSGDAVLAWSESGSRPRLLLRHFELSAEGEFRLYSFVDAGNPRLLLGPCAGDVRLRDGVAHVATDASSGMAFVFLADPDANAVGLLGIEVQRVENPGGIGASPVPVTFKEAVTSDSVGGAQPTLGGAGETALGGTLIAPFRVELLGAEVYYWFDADTVRAVAFRGPRALPLIVADAPVSELHGHFSILQSVRRQLLQDGIGGPAITSRTALAGSRSFRR